MEKVLLGMSGGVDSTAAAIILKKQGYEVIGVTMKLWKDSNEKTFQDTAIEDAKYVCEKLGVQHIVLDLEKEFKDIVVKDFIEKYAKSKTPNPCIVCNKYLKFGILFEKALELGCKYLATGHYANIEKDEKTSEYKLCMAASLEKDQSYVLYNIPRGMLKNVLFPLGKFMTKDETRNIVLQEGLDILSRKKDSQEICFIPNDDHISFLEKYISKKSGNIVHSSGLILGKHQGTYRYTIGQRKGLGISYKEPLYVTEIDGDKNEILVGDKQEIYKKELMAENINTLCDVSEIDGKKLTAKIRYSSKPEEAYIYIEKNKLKVVFTNPVKAITSGQSVVIYDGKRVLAGGEII